jgi:hypothetical protein
MQSSIKSMVIFMATAALLCSACRKETVQELNGADNNMPSSKKTGEQYMTLYNWRYLPGPGFVSAEENDIQMAVNRADWPEFIALLTKMKNGHLHNAKLPLAPLPPGSPHQLDVVTEVFNFPNAQFVELDLVRFSKPADEIWVNVKNNNRLQIRATEAGFVRLLGLMTKVQTSASIYGNTTTVLLQKNDTGNGEGGPFEPAKLVMWGVNDVGEIVYN